MNRRRALAGLVLAALGIRAAPVAAQGPGWIDILTNEPVPGMVAPYKLVNAIWESYSIDLLYLFPAGTVPCIVGVHESQYDVLAHHVHQRLRG